MEERAKDIMMRQVQHMVRLVDDLLDVSRITRDNIELRKERVELASIVARAVETAQPIIDAQEHELSLSLPSEPVWLEADVIRLTQVLGNLLTNAAKYTEKGGHIWLRAGREGAEVVLRVKDTGIGIDAEMLPRIFGLFVQVERARDRSQGGIGVGLALVRKLVEMHGGSVTAASEGPNRGSEFTLRLPVSTVVRCGDDARSNDKKAALKQSLPRLRVLVVDDNKDGAESLAMMLRLEGHEVLVAHSGAAALEMSATHRPQLAFLDLGMPGMDGYELCRRMRAQPASAKAMLVALTGWGQEEDIRRTAEAGFDRHLIKPMEPRSLQRLLSHPSLKEQQASD
jgi:CheY-like chemotaxis protein/two-component sensor histidine kinase